MHELSIATRVVDLAIEHCRREGAARVRSLTLRIGRLSGVHPAALEAALAVVREKTPLADAAVVMEEVPIRIWCAPCGREVELPGIQSLRCPCCGAAGSEMRAGRELDLDTLELEFDDPAETALP
jgi:hydrogenase nickel incorporation protein HypA/HybF